MKDDTIAQVLNDTTTKFSDAGIDTARLDAEVLLAHVLNCRRLSLYVNVKNELTEEQLKKYNSLVAGRLENIPVAYLTGYKEFMGLKFAVTPEVLIPRPETEILAQGVIEHLINFEGEFTLADLCCGSGAIGISVLKFLEHITVDAVDISPDAIAISKFNAKKFNVEDRINFYKGDLFEPLAGKKYNVIVSNPPYIPTEDLKNLQAEVKKEPKIALDGGEDGLIFYKQIIKDAPNFLADGGFLAMEVGINEAEPVKKMIEESGIFGTIQFWQDLASIDRVVATWKK